MARKRKFIDYEEVREIPIHEVAEWLGMRIRKDQSGWVMLEEDGKGETSLHLFNRNNKWKRFSGIEQNGVSQGSTMDLVMHINGVDFQEAAQQLSRQFL